MNLSKKKNKESNKRKKERIVKKRGKHTVLLLFPLSCNCSGKPLQSTLFVKKQSFLGLDLTFVLWAVIEVIGVTNGVSKLMKRKKNKTIGNQKKKKWNSQHKQTMILKKIKMKKKTEATIFA